eukprot:748008-Hanusia_phi.AAC.2
MKRAGSCSASDRQRDAVRLSSFSLSLHVGSDKPREGEGKGRKPSLGRLVKAGALRSSFTSLEIDEPATSRHIGSPERGGKDVFVGATSAVRQSFSPTRNFNQVVSRTLERARPIDVRRDDLRRPSPSACPARNSPSGRCHVNVGTRSRRTPGRHGETDQQHPQQPTSQRRDLSLRLEPFRGSAVLPHQLLERVSIEGCGLVSIPPPVMSLKHLTYLDVSWNGIRSLPSNIRIMKVRELLLCAPGQSVTQLAGTGLTGRFFQPPHACARGQAQTFPDSYLSEQRASAQDIGRLTQLQTLKVGDNFLYRLPSTLDFHFFRLSQLHAQYNDLSVSCDDDAESS